MSIIERLTDEELIRQFKKNAKVNIEQAYFDQEDYAGLFVPGDRVLLGNLTDRIAGLRSLHSIFISYEATGSNRPALIRTNQELLLTKPGYSVGTYFFGVLAEYASVDDFSRGFEGECPYPDGPRVYRNKFVKESFVFKSAITVIPIFNP